MMASRKRAIEDALSGFLSCHSLQSSISSIDEVVLAYVISMFQNLSSGASFEEDVDVDYFIEMMDAYLPGFGEIDSTLVYQWMFELAAKLNTEDMKDRISDIAAGQNTESFDDRVQSEPKECPPRNVGNRRVRKKSTSKNSPHQTKVENTNNDFPVTEDNGRLDDGQIHLLLEMFPAACSVEVAHCLMLANENTDEAAQLILHRQEMGDSILSSSDGTQKAAHASLHTLNDARQLKQNTMSRYGYIDEDDDKREHNPTAPKVEPKKLIRYLDGRVVSTKGQKFTEIKREESEEEKKSYINLKPARKYRFH